jgi:hypothetical protein
LPAYVAAYVDAYVAAACVVAYVVAAHVAAYIAAYVSAAYVVSYLVTKPPDDIRRLRLAMLLLEHDNKVLEGRVSLVPPPLHHLHKQRLRP